MPANLVISGRSGDRGDVMKKILLLAVTFMLSVVPDCAEEAAQAFYPGAAIAGFSAPDQSKPRIAFGKSLGKRPQTGTLILAGMLGNIVGVLAGGYLGAPTFDEDKVLPFISCLAAGSAFGSATAVNLVGHSRYWHGNFGMACIGGALGAGLSWLIVTSPVFQGDMGIVSLLPLLVLPPIGAAVFFKASMKPRRIPENHSLLNVSTGRLALGVPDIQVRPLFVPGGSAKPEFQFNVNVLSVEL